MTMANITVNIREFSEYPGLRNCDISDKSGEEFYHLVLNGALHEAIQQNEKLVVDLDGVDAYAPSFLDEAFGNLVYDFTLEKVREFVDIISNEESHWTEMIRDKTYKEWENRRMHESDRRTTRKHNEWWRLQGDKFVLGVWSEPSAK